MKYSFDLFNHLKMLKPFLAHGLYKKKKKERGIWPAIWAMSMTLVWSPKDLGVNCGSTMS